MKTRAFHVGLALGLLTSLSLGSAHAAFTWDAALTLFDAAHAPPAFAPTDANDGMGDWKPCLNRAFDYQPVTVDAQNNLIPACQPDTIYSWSKSFKLVDLVKSANPDAQAWNQPFEDLLFAHINPLATFGYGDIGIRIKLKPTTRFKYYGEDRFAFKDYCTQLLTTDEERQNTIIVRAFNHPPTSGVDYILCTAGPIQSWSYGTQRHYDEIAASQLWNNAGVAANQKNRWISYTVTGGNRDLYSSGLDGVKWGLEDMLNNFRTMQNVAQRNRGEIFYAPGVAHDEAEHFKSNHRVYWHWN
jgi:hypothetical protein